MCPILVVPRIPVKYVTFVTRLVLAESLVLRVVGWFLRRMVEWVSQAVALEEVAEVEDSMLSRCTIILSVNFEKLLLMACLLSLYSCLLVDRFCQI